MDEKTKRIFAGSIVKAYGHGGTDLSHSITGLRAASIKMGVDQINGKVVVQPDKQRKSGGGRKKITEIYPGVSLLQQVVISAGFSLKKRLLVAK